MRTVSKGDIFDPKYIPSNLGLEHGFDNTDQFYLVKENDDGMFAVVGYVKMSSKGYLLSVKPERGEKDADLLQYFVDIDDSGFWWGPKFNIYTFKYVEGPFIETDDYKWHTDYPKLRLLPKSK